MHKESICRSKHFAFTLAALLAIILGCGKPAQQASPQPSPAATPTPLPGSADQGLSALGVSILNKAHRSGSVILRGQCGPHSIDQQYTLPRTARLEPMDQALQEISAKYQNVYWRESPTTGVRVADSTAKAKLLAVRVREFRIVEDREPDRVMAILWRTPEVQTFLRRNHVRFGRRADGAKKVLSPPMIVEMKNRTVGEILDRIAAGYRQTPPKVWVYQECSQNKDTLIDVQIR